MRPGKRRHSDGIALTKGLLIAVSRLSGDGLPQQAVDALDELNQHSISSQCFLL